MTSRKTLILIAAIAIGTVAAYVLWSYVQGVKTDLEDGAQRTDVFMVITDIPENTRGEDAQRTSIEVREIPNDIKPANAVTDLAQITGKVAASTMVTNEILKVGDFIDPVVKQTSFSDLLPEGMITASINIDRVRAAGGFLAPGDEVNMMILQDGWIQLEEDEDDGIVLSAEDEAYNIATEATPYQNPARFFYQKVKILAIDNQLSPRAGEEVVDTGVTVTGGGIITIAAPPDAILRIMSVPSSAIAFNLLPDGYEPAVWNHVTADEIVLDVLPGEDENFLTPYGPGGYEAFINGETDGSAIAFDDTAGNGISPRSGAPAPDEEDAADEDNPFDGETQQDAAVDDTGDDTGADENPFAGTGE